MERTGGREPSFVLNLETGNHHLRGVEQYDTEPVRNPPQAGGSTRLPSVNHPHATPVQWHPPSAPGPPGGRSLRRHRPATAAPQSAFKSPAVRCSRPHRSRESPLLTSIRQRLLSVVLERCARARDRFSKMASARGGRRVWTGAGCSSSRWADVVHRPGRRGTSSAPRAP